MVEHRRRQRGYRADAFRAYAREGISHLQVWVNPMTPAGVEQVAAALRLLDRN